MTRGHDARALLLLLIVTLHAISWKQHKEKTVSTGKVPAVIVNVTGVTLVLCVHALRLVYYCQNKIIVMELEPGKSWWISLSFWLIKMGVAVLSLCQFNAYDCIVQNVHGVVLNLCTWSWTVQESKVLLNRMQPVLGYRINFKIQSLCLLAHMVCVRIVGVFWVAVRATSPSQTCSWW